MDKIINGKEVADKLREELKQKIKSLPSTPKLVVIQVGDYEASNVYVRGKEKACKEVGIDFELIHYPYDVDAYTVANTINKLNNDDKVNGILIQLPLLDHIDNTIIDLINPIKDVDGLTSYNMGRLINNDYDIAPATPSGVIKLLDYYNIPIAGKHVVVVGRSNLVGKPISQLFLHRDATVTICHSKTKDLTNYTNQADILAVATGHKHLITKDMIKDNAILIDIGISRVGKKLYGDINFDDVYDKCSYITPVPGGVGPMTIAMLLYNVVKCYKLQNKIK